MLKENLKNHLPSQHLGIFLDSNEFRKNTGNDVKRVILAIRSMLRKCGVWRNLKLYFRIRHNICVISFEFHVISSNITLYTLIKINNEIEPRLINYQVTKKEL